MLGVFGKRLICVVLGQHVDWRLKNAVSHAYNSISECQPVQSGAFGQHLSLSEKSSKQPVETI